MEIPSLNLVFGQMEVILSRNMTLWPATILKPFLQYVGNGLKYLYQILLAYTRWNILLKITGSKIHGLHIKNLPITTACLNLISDVFTRFGMCTNIGLLEILLVTSVT